MKQNMYPESKKHRLTVRVPAMFSLLNKDAVVNLRRAIESLDENDFASHKRHVRKNINFWETLTEAAYLFFSYLPPPGSIEYS